MSGTQSALMVTGLEVWNPVEFRRSLAAHEMDARQFRIGSLWDSLRAAARGHSRPAIRSRIAVTLFDAFKQDAALKP